MKANAGFQKSCWQLATSIWPKFHYVETLNILKSTFEIHTKDSNLKFTNH
jgi:hypothetical protein